MQLASSQHGALGARVAVIVYIHMELLRGREEVGQNGCNQDPDFTR